jgi:hypothetical protein
MSIPRSLVPVLATLALASCWWVAPARDGGHEAFAARAVETVLGRKPHGAAEVQALAELAAHSGREAVLAVLFEQPEYVSYWSNVLGDSLQLQRGGAMQIAADCLAPPLLSPSLSSALAGHLASALPDQPFCVSQIPPQDWGLGLDQFEDILEKAVSGYPHVPLEQIELAPPLPGPVSPKFANPQRPEVWHAPLGALRANDDYVSEGQLNQAPSEASAGRWLDLSTVAQSSSCPPFNLTDVLEAAVRTDRLEAAYRAYLPVLASFPGTSVDLDMREQLGSLFLEVYLDRDPACMGCHSATYSTTDARPRNGNWDRYESLTDGSVPLDIEGTVFSYDLPSGDFVYQGEGGAGPRQSVENFFRPQNHAASGVIPWGMDEACVTNPSLGFGGLVRVLHRDLVGGRSPAAFAGLGPGDDLGVLDLVVALSDGTSTMDTLDFVVPDWEAHRAARMGPPRAGSCAGCHGGPVEGVPRLETIVPTLSDERLFSIIRHGSGRMAQVTTSDSEAWSLVDWVRDHYPYTPALQLEDRRHAFVYLVAASLVQQVVDEVMGEDLSMRHGYPRNPEQAQALQQLLATQMEGLSLRALLTEIVLSPAFNRRAPADPSTVPYDLPMVLWPEAELAPSVTSPPVGANANSEGDLVHTRSPAALMQQLHGALGWPAPPVAGYPDGIWPSQELMSSLGRYTSRDRPPPEDFDISRYVSWESEGASCQKPSAVYARDLSLAQPRAPWGELWGPDKWSDWIDLLIVEADTRPMSWWDLAAATKDRLLADPTLTYDEVAGLRALWGVPDLSAVPDASLHEEALRSYCSVLLSSPQFVLGGLHATPPLPKSTPAPVCLPGEICGLDPLFDSYLSQAEALGF